MQYTMEELVPIVALLTDKYTGKESTSITYEKAQQLMNAVIYCINEWNRSFRSKSSTQTSLMDQQHTLSAKQAYEQGYNLVVKKVKKSLELYNEILTDFDSYGSKSLEETFLKGMPAFFMWYDARFEPQNTILTLDYPVPMDYTKICGADAIYRYLTLIKKEQDYLKQFPRENVIARLRAYHPHYEELFENLTEMTGKL